MLQMVATCISVLIVFVLLLMPGFFSAKKGFINSNQVDGFSFLLTNFLWPAMIIDVMNDVELSKEMIDVSIYTAGVSLLYYFIIGTLAFLYWKVRKSPKVLMGILIFATTVTNTGFIGIPLIRIALGEEAMFVSAIAEVINDLVIFTVGLVVLQSGKSEKKLVDFKAMCSPGFLSVIVGLLIFGFQIELPGFLSQTLSYMSNAVTPIAMFLLGAQLAEIEFKSVLKDRKILEVMGLRLLVVPALVTIMLLILSPGPALANKVIIMMAAMPSASCLAIFSRTYKLDYKFGTACVMSTTLGLLATLSVWLFVLNLVF
ncbi:MAG: AEC family transporter [Dorea sp.]